MKDGTSQQPLKIENVFGIKQRNAGREGERRELARADRVVWCWDLVVVRLCGLGGGCYIGGEGGKGWGPQRDKRAGELKWKWPNGIWALGGEEDDDERGASESRGKVKKETWSARRGTRWGSAHVDMASDEAGMWG